MPKRRRRKRIIRVVDLFCGAGGSSSGMKQAAKRMGRRLHMTVINHWECAVQTHKANHPDIEHLCDSLEEIDPRKVVPSGKLDALWASPECIGFSNAAGGVPRSEQSRTGAWHVRDWARDLDIPLIIVENIKEFRKWKPLTKAGKPDKRYRDGHTFRRWITAMEALGYTAEWRVLRSADYGDPTTRERLFLVFRKGRKPVHWPEPTHIQGGNGKPGWVPAREIIDWGVRGKSIFTRKTPLRPKTLARIAAGLRKFGGALAEPFLVMLYGTGTSRSVDRPLPTVTAKGKHIGLCEPFLVHYHGDHEGRDDGSKRVKSVDDPLPTQDTANRYGLCEPFMIPQQSGGAPRSVDDPVPTVSAAGAISVIEPHISIFKGRSKARSVKEPLPTITGQNCHALIEPFLVKYNGTGEAVSIDEPLHTISAKARFGLVEINGQPYRMDILFRMLLVKELAAAMGFPTGYEFYGTKADQIRQIGNAVSVRLASELSYCNLAA